MVRVIIKYSEKNRREITFRETRMLHIIWLVEVNFSFSIQNSQEADVTTTPLRSLSGSSACFTYLTFYFMSRLPVLFSWRQLCLVHGRSVISIGASTWLASSSALALSSVGSVSPAMAKSISSKCQVFRRRHNTLSKWKQCKTLNLHREETGPHRWGVSRKERQKRGSTSSRWLRSP